MKSTAYFLTLLVVFACSAEESDNVGSAEEDTTSEKQFVENVQEDTIQSNHPDYEIEKVTEGYKVRHKKFQFESVFPGPPEYKINDFTKKGGSEIAYIFNYTDENGIVRRVTISEYTDPSKVWSYDDKLAFWQGQQIENEFEVHEIDFLEDKAIRLKRTQFPFNYYELHFLRDQCHYCFEIVYDTAEQMASDKGASLDMLMESFRFMEK